MSLRDFCKSHYALEITRKSALTPAMALPVGVLSLLVGALVAMSKELHLPLNLGEQLQLAAMVAGTAVCAAAGYFLFRSLYNFEYG